MEYNYYSLDECRTRDKVIERLEKLKDLGKINYDIDSDDILEIDDIDLDEEETESLEDFLYDNDVMPYLEREDEDEDDFDDFYDDYDDY
jgi:hypothetical protein